MSRRRPELRGAVLGELGEAEALARDPAAAAHLREALELSDDPFIRARIAAQLGSLLVWVGQPLEGYALLAHTIDALPDDADPALRATLETVRVATASVDRRLVGEVAPRLPSLHELAEAAGPAGNALLIFEACWRAQSGPYAGDWRELVDRGLDGGRFVARQTASSPIVGYATAVLVLADEIERAEALIADIRADARARGSIEAHLAALTWGSLLALRRGDLPQAESDARTTLELANRHEVLWTRIWSTAFLVHALVERGELEEADRALAEGRIESALGSAATLHALLARGRLHLAQGRRAEAIADLRATGDSVIVNNPSYVPWRSELALALAREEPDQALELADGELVRARELGQPRGIGVALRARGILEGGDGRDRAAGAKRSRRCETRRPASSWRAPSATWDRRSGAPGSAALRASRCARRSNSLSAAMPRRWPGEPAKSCWQPGPIRGASACRVPTP